MKTPLSIIGLILLFTSCKPALPPTDVKKENLVACETGIGVCQPIEVVRHENNAKTIVRFLISPNRTRMQLFDSTYRNQIATGNENSIKPIISDFLKENNFPAFDLTALPNGKYFVQIIGDDVGGIFELNIKTKS